MKDWRKYTAQEFCLNVTDGTHDSPKPTEVGHYLITSKHLQNNAIDFSSAYKISEEDYQKVIKRSAVVQHDILFSMIGTIGNTVRVKDPIINYAVKNMAIFKMGYDELKSKWLYYWLKSSKAKEYISSRLAGSTQSYLTLETLRTFPVFAPSENEMQKIVSILSSIDDKIELNRQINDNLEQQAKALYKSWFIDFEPFADSEFVDSEIGEIPKELRVDHIGSISHRIESGRRPKGGACDSGVPSVGAENIKKLGYYDFSKTKYIPTDFANNITRGKVNGYELLIYKDGGKPGYFLPSFSIFGDGFPYDVFYINEHVFILDLKNDQYNAFAYFYMQTDYIMTQLNALGGKAAIPGINTSDVESLPIISYSHPKVQEFGKYAHDIVKTILRNSRENARLAQLRDTLLPKLMSGELKINEIDC